MGVNTPFKLCSSGLIHGYLYNRHGERFMAKWDPERMERSTRDIIAIGIATEILEGQRQFAWWGRRLAGTYARQSNRKPQRVASTQISGPLWRLRHDEISPRSTKYAVESIPGCHFFNGGIKIDAGCRNDIPGLYASGEVTGGIHGANRLSGNAFTEMVVWGHRAAIGIAEDLQKKYFRGELDQKQIRDCKAKNPRPVEQTEGRGCRKLRAELMKTAWENVGVVRNEELLRQAKAKIEELHEAGEKIALSYRGKIWNRSWLRAIEFRNMVDNLLMITETALSRQESRGSHYRKDFPQTDNVAWLKNQIIVRRDGQLTIRTSTPCVTSINPPLEVKKYGI